MENFITANATQVITAGRENGVSNVLFRNAVGMKLGLNNADMECLDLLFFRQISSPAELAQYTGLTSGAATSMLDRLEKKGLIARQPHPSDRRSVQIVLVPEAMENIRPLFASVRAAQTELLAAYTPEQLGLLAQYFEQSAKMWDQERSKL
jgi:DNA-binding MarR family transcriptional regulator